MNSVKNKIIALLILIAVSLIMMASVMMGMKAEHQEEIFLTPEEVEWLKNHQDMIKIGYTIDYPPVEFLQYGKYVGISADYFELLEEKLDIKIQMVQFDTFGELMQEIEKGNLAGITAATKTQERDRYLDFTVPYIENPNVIITQKNFSEKLTFEKLANASMDVLVIEGFDIIEILDEGHPKLKYRTVPTPSEGLNMVTFGEADAIIMEIMTASAIMEKNNISNIMVNVETPYESDLSIATRADLPILNRIFNKGLAQITSSERKAIEQKWVHVYRDSFFENPYFWTLLLIIASILIVLIVAVSVWNTSLQEAIKLREKELEESRRELMHKTYHDNLTGLYNRVYLAEVIEEYEQKDVLPFSVLLADMNGLKMTNDTLGHEAGDCLLRKMAEIIMNKTREDHVVCRFGGDEVLVLMPHTDEEEVAQIAKEILLAVQEAEEDPVKPYMALGYATMEEKFDINSYTNLFKVADHRMYAQKLAEKDKVSGLILETIHRVLAKQKADEKKG